MKRVILLLFFPLLAIADPGAATKYYMDKPTSLFDLGMYRANLYLSSIEREVGISFDVASGAESDIHGLTSEYVYNVDKIVVLSDHAVDRVLALSRLESGCDHILWLLEVRTKYIPAMFLPSVVSENGHDYDALGALMNRIEIRCQVRDASTGDVLLIAALPYGGNVRTDIVLSKPGVKQ